MSGMTEKRVFDNLLHEAARSHEVAKPGSKPSPKVFRTTNQHQGWREFFSPSSGATRYLSYARLVCGASVQFVYSSFDSMECCEPVRDGDCVAVPYGYRPTAAAPGASSCFLWCMAAFDPEKHRDLKYGVNIQPDYKDIKLF
jgi:hypothetical protein